MFLRTAILLAATSAYIDGSVIGIGYDIWIEGEYASLTEVEEQTLYYPDDLSEQPYLKTYSNTNDSLTGGDHIW